MNNMVMILWQDNGMGTANMPGKSGQKKDNHFKDVSHQQPVL